ncbi:sugar-binding protein [Carnobacterium divergens]|uniref:sugar-binding transcriptional regulator n=1 Tax=Carnobacterium divergens TaxID=2748 RepID=UPI000E715E4C|nr:sugar-binding transcriptional regulator [Carnobacterium divergens]ANZ99167.1 sugar-binding protein [Carnobacterium divergens]
MRITEDRRNLLKAATMYYSEGKTQAEIAKKMNISRPVISKMLQLARQEGIVEIYVKDENAHSIALALEIEKKYQLNDVIVVPKSIEFSKSTIKHNVAKVAVSYLTTHLKKDTKIGLSWGTTIAEVIDEMPYLSKPGITIHPLVGGIQSQHVYLDANHLTFLLAEKLSAQCSYFYAPALADTIELKELLAESTVVETAMSDARKVELAIIGVGNPLGNTTWKELGYIEKKELIQANNQGIVGDAVASLFDETGQTVMTDLTKRMMGMTIEDLIQIPNVVAIASGSTKGTSIQALLNNHVINTLIIDQSIAEQLN